MHCKACNSSLSDFEATRIDIESGEEFVDLCNGCLTASGCDDVPMGRLDLMDASDELLGLPDDPVEVLMGYHDTEVVDNGGNWG